MNLTAITVGTAQDGGSPQVGSAAQGPHRTASSLLLRNPEGESILFDASPDLRMQYAALRSEGLVHALLAGVVLTHAHMGHYAGLVHFGKEAMAADGLPLWATPAMLGFLASNQPWRALIDGGHLSPHELAPGAGSKPLPGVDMTLIEVPHRGEFSDTVAVSAGGLLYLPDIDSWDEWPAARSVVADHDVAFLDATFWSQAEIPGRDIARIPHPFVPDTLERFSGLATRIVLTHLNHTNPCSLPDSPEAGAVVAAGMEVAEEMGSYEN